MRGRRAPRPNARPLVPRSGAAGILGGVKIWLSLLALALPLACTGAAEGGAADARALQAATAELAAARATWDEERAATTKELAELRAAVTETNTKLAALEAARRPPPIPVPGPVDPYLLPEAEDPSMSVDIGSGPPVIEESLAAFVQCESASHCKVEKAWLEALLADPVAAARQVRFVPKTDGEKPVGIKLYGIRRGSLPKAIGLKNGDMIKSINGFSMGSLDRMLEAYAKLRRETKLTLEIERKGVSLTHIVEIVEHL